jgi:hypothetical protein
MAQMADSPTPSAWRAWYARGPEEFETALAGLTEADLDLSIAAGEWTIREIVNHVAEVEVRATFMMTVAMGNSGTPFTFDWFPGTNKAWGRALAFERRPIAPSLAIIRQVRAYILVTLDAITDAEARHIMFSYAHAEEGWEPSPFTVGEMVQGYSEHITEHVAEIGAIRAQHGI